jgi:hypothetical protein
MSNRLNRKTSVQLLQTIQNRDEALAELANYVKVQGEVIDDLNRSVKTSEAGLVSSQRLVADRDAIISALTSTNDKLQALVDALTAVANDAVKPLPISEPAAELVPDAGHESACAACAATQAEVNPNGDAQQLIGS